MRYLDRASPSALLILACAFWGAEPFSTKPCYRFRPSPCSSCCLRQARRPYGRRRFLLGLLGPASMDGRQPRSHPKVAVAYLLWIDSRRRARTPRRRSPNNVRRRKSDEAQIRLLSANVPGWSPEYPEGVLEWKSAAPLDAVDNARAEAGGRGSA